MYIYIYIYYVYIGLTRITYSAWLTLGSPEAEYIIHMRVVAPQEYVNIYSTRRVNNAWWKEWKSAVSLAKRSPSLGTVL